jgi:hypothetical protein
MRLRDLLERLGNGRIRGEVNWRVFDDMKNCGDSLNSGQSLYAHSPMLSSLRCVVEIVYSRENPGIHQYGNGQYLLSSGHIHLNET